MTTSALIDKIISYFENTSATDSYNTRRRARILEWAQEVVDDFWHYRNWSFRMGTSSITVPASQGYVAVPTDFEEFGPQGGAYDSNGYKLIEVSPQEIQEAFQSGTSTATPAAFAVYTSDTGVRRFWIPKNSGALTFTLYYYKTTPVLVDTTGATNNLDDVPAGYHHTVLLAGVKAKSARSSGDARAAEFEMIYQRGINRAAIEEKGRRSSTRRLPMAVGGGMW